MTLRRHTSASLLLSTLVIIGACFRGVTNPVDPVSEHQNGRPVEAQGATGATGTNGITISTAHDEAQTAFRMVKQRRPFLARYVADGVVVLDLDRDLVEIVCAPQLVDLIQIWEQMFLDTARPPPMCLAVRDNGFICSQYAAGVPFLGFTFHPTDRWKLVSVIIGSALDRVEARRSELESKVESDEVVEACRFR